VSLSNRVMLWHAQAHYGQQCVYVCVRMCVHACEYTRQVHINELMSAPVPEVSKARPVPVWATVRVHGCEYTEYV